MLVDIDENFIRPPGRLAPHVDLIKGDKVEGFFGQAVMPERQGFGI